MLEESSLIRRFRRPEYTGENRCLACTLVNVWLVTAMSVVIALLVSALTGLLVLAAGVVVIYLRGYVVPGTPTFTKYLPDSILVKFDQHGASEGLTGDQGLPDDESVIGSKSHRNSAPDLDPETVLFRADAIKECDEIDDLCLRDEFRTVWYEHIHELRDDETLKTVLRETLELDEGDLTIDGSGDPLIVRSHGEVIAGWNSRAAAIADFAGKQVLKSKSPDWNEFDITEQSEIARSLRTFLDLCPECDDYVTVEQLSSCCASGYSMTIMHCSNCESVLFESKPQVDLTN